jgi:hypothetical protein
MIKHNISVAPYSYFLFPLNSTIGQFRKYNQLNNMVRLYDIYFKYLPTKSSIKLDQNYWYDQEERLRIINIHIPEDLLKIENFKIPTIKNTYQVDIINKEYNKEGIVLTINYSDSIIYLKDFLSLTNLLPFGNNNSVIRRIINRLLISYLYYEYDSYINSEEKNIYNLFSHNSELLKCFVALIQDLEFYNNDEIISNSNWMTINETSWELFKLINDCTKYNISIIKVYKEYEGINQYDYEFRIEKLNYMDLENIGLKFIDTITYAL